MVYSEDTTTTIESMEGDDSVSQLTAKQKLEYQVRLRNTLVKERRKKQNSILQTIKNFF